MFVCLTFPGLLSYSGGVPVSLYHSREQWDAPNGFAPMMDMLIEGLHNAQHRTDQSQEIGMKLCRKWLRINLNTHVKNEHMLEKVVFESFGNFFWFLDYVLSSCRVQCTVPIIDSEKAEIF